ncbi:MAG: hypothetical protein HY342_07975 [Candidatus Lambdaproteobacteria bacterium]|nr:hypothetical protein [Candidatus Lambdaproteobacteria bacterium]
MTPSTQQPAAQATPSRRGAAQTAFPKPYPQSVVVRPKYGDEMEGIALHANGIAFRAPAPIPGGKVLEVILCRGSIMVDAEVVHCAPVPAEPGLFAVRARFLHASPELLEFIAEEAERPQA